MSLFSYSIPSRETILTILRTSGAQNITLLAMKLKVKLKEIDGLTRRLHAMKRDGQIKFNHIGNYEVIDSTNFVVGRVSRHRDNFGFLLPDDGSQDIFLSGKEIKKVLHGDRVKVKIIEKTRRSKLEGRIVEVISRAHTHIIGRLFNKNNIWIVSPEDKRISKDIVLIEVPNKKVNIGQIVNVQLTEQPSRYTKPQGKIIEILGNIDDPGIEIEIAVRKYKLPYKFSEAAKTQAANLPNEILPIDLINRIDLRNLPFLTIDSEDACDLDDAIYCEPIPQINSNNNAYRLVVAIADVSHYVKCNDALDSDALIRSTSIYFPHRVILMLPKKLSNILCSLNPHVDRLVLICDMIISIHGEIKTYQFYAAVIHSVARLTYNEVTTILTNPQSREINKYHFIIKHLIYLDEVFKILLKARQIRGVIDFEIAETHIIFNSVGKIEKILPQIRNDAHRLVEECMLSANVCAADLLYRYKHPGLFRVHASPTKEKLNQLRIFLKKINLNLSGGDEPSIADYTKLMLKIKYRSNATLIQTMLLRSMQQAFYSPKNIGHFGLSYPLYMHFTSPIRRYPDLLTHRAIKAILHGDYYEPKLINTKLVDQIADSIKSKIYKQNIMNINPQQPEDKTFIWEILGSHCSIGERRADEASRDVEAWLKCYFIRDKLGEEFSGTISGVVAFGIFVQLDTLYIEGMVHITELGTDDFQFDQIRQELRGEKTGIYYQLMDRVIVKIHHVDLDARKIDLWLINKLNN